MPDTLATEFQEILPALSENEPLRARVLDLIKSEPVVGKVTEGGSRLTRLRDLLTELVNGDYGLDRAIANVNIYLPRLTSTYSSDNRVFSSGWEERLVRVQLSRFYNQAVMEMLLEEGETQCFVPHSSVESRVSGCTTHLAGHNQNLQVMHSLLVKSYGQGDFSDKSPKVPDHPHCTHVVTRTS